MELNNLNDMTAFVASVKAARLPPPPNSSNARSCIGDASPAANHDWTPLQRNTRNRPPTKGGCFTSAAPRHVLEELEKRRAIPRPTQHQAARPSSSAPLVLGKTILPPLLVSTAIRKPTSNSRSPTTADLISRRLRSRPAQRQSAPMRQPDIHRRRPANAHLCRPGYLVQHGTPQSPDDLARRNACVPCGGPRRRWRFQQKAKETAFQGCGPSADNTAALLELALVRISA